jgi:arginine/lysine/ornithine decarboxylase
VKKNWPIYEFILGELKDFPLINCATPVHGLHSKLSKIWFKFEIDGIERLDLPYIPKDIIKLSEKESTMLYKTNATFYFPTGTSHAVLAGIIGTFGPKDTVIVGRNIHISVLSALTLIGCQLIWLLPENHWFSYSPQKIKKYLELYPNARGLILTNPSYEGHGSDISSISKMCRKKNIYLIIDESLGSHWPTLGDSSASSLYTNVDMVFHSLHKRVGALVPAALLHLPQNSRIGIQKITVYNDMIRSTSPSNLVLISTELAVQNYFVNTLENYKELLFACKEFRAKIYKSHQSLLKIIASNFYDPLTLHIPLFFNSKLLSDEIVKNNINYEHVDERGIICFISLEENLNNLKKIFIFFHKLMEKYSSDNGQSFNYHSPKTVYSPNETMQKVFETIKFDKQAIGRIGYENYAICPPGIPLLISGEIIQEWHIERIPLSYIKVLKE